MLRLQNGVYLQLHAYMFRVAIPYERCRRSSCGRWRMSRGAMIAATATSPRGKISSSTGSSSPNCRMRWPISPRSAFTPCRPQATTRANVTSDQWAGVAPGEVEDPRIWSELLRQYTTLHPEFLLPAAQVQICDYRLRSRSRGDQGARYWPQALQERGGRNRIRGAGRRRPRPHALHRQDDKTVRARPRSAELCRGDPARLQPVRPPRQTSTRRASRSWCMSSASRSSPGKSRRMAADARQRAGDR